MTTRALSATGEVTEAFLAPFMLAAMLSLALPVLTRQAPPQDGGPEPEAPPFTPEQAADIVAAVNGLALDHGMVTSPAAAGSYGLVDASRDWATGMHRDRQVRVVDGAGAGQMRVIADNSESTLVVQTPWTRPLDATSVYVILNS